MNNIIQKMNSNLFGKGKEKILECFYINRSKELYFSEILREKKLNKLPSERKRAIIEFLEKLENKPLIVLVFGSTAKGTFGKESDIDLLLIYNKKESENKELKKEIEATTGTNIQTFIIDFDYFKEQLLKQEDNMIIHAIKTGFIISGHYIFYKDALK